MINRILQVLYKDLSTGALVLEAPYDYSYEIVEIGADGNSDDGIDIVIGSEKMGYFPVKAAVDSVIAPPYVNSNIFGHFETIRAKYPQVPRMIVGEGEKMVITNRTNQLGLVWVWYIEHKGPEKPKNTDLGGSQNPTRYYAICGVSGVAVPNGVTLISTITTPSMPPGYGSFPFTGVVPANTKYTILGMVVGFEKPAAPHCTLLGVRLWRNNQSLLAKNEAFALPTFFPPQNITTKIRNYYFEQPIVFDVNETASVECQVQNTHSGPETPIVHVVFLTIVSPATA